VPEGRMGRIGRGSQNFQELELAEIISQVYKETGFPLEKLDFKIYNFLLLPNVLFPNLTCTITEAILFNS
jgi:hypothetical protein